jgi:hypothetical protein
LSSGFVVRALLVALPAFGLALGFAMPLLGLTAWQDRVWAGFTTPVLIVVCTEN